MLEVRSIYKTFHAGTLNEVRSLRGVNLELEAGSWVIIIGTNGSGKSTFLNAVAGTFFVDEGSITLAGRDVTRWPEHARASLIGRVFQNPFSGTSPSLTIQENLSLAARRGVGARAGLGVEVVAGFADARGSFPVGNGIGRPFGECDRQSFGRTAAGAYAFDGYVVAAGTFAFG